MIKLNNVHFVRDVDGCISEHRLLKIVYLNKSYLQCYQGCSSDTKRIKELRSRIQFYDKLRHLVQKKVCLNCNFRTSIFVTLFYRLGMTKIPLGTQQLLLKFLDSNQFRGGYIGYQNRAYYLIGK